MAGGGTPAPTKGGKKSVDFIVNLVPTIDLMSVLISFLLITAVWTELARINTDQVLQKTSDKVKDEPKKERRDLMLLLAESGDLHLRFTGKDPMTIKAGANLLIRFRDTYNQRFKATADEDQKVIVSAEDRVPYDRLIALMDMCLDMELKGLAIGDPEGFD
jgi:biopolymer transport protein ExbD